MRIKIVASAVAALFVTALIIGWSQPPRFLIGYLANPEIAFQDILNRSGGRLPRTESDLASALLGGTPPGVALYPVVDWKLEEVQMRNSRSLALNLADDDPTYGIDAVLNVRYADGRNVRLRWSTWSYGFIIGPFVVSLGDGPPGYLTPISPV